MGVDLRARSLVKFLIFFFVFVLIWDFYARNDRGCKCWQVFSFAILHSTILNSTNDSGYTWLVLIFKKIPSSFIIEYDLSKFPLLPSFLGVFFVCVCMACVWIFQRFFCISKDHHVIFLLYSTNAIVATSESVFMYSILKSLEYAQLGHDAISFSYSIGFSLPLFCHF